MDFEELVVTYILLNFVDMCSLDEVRDYDYVYFAEMCQYSHVLD